MPRTRTAVYWQLGQQGLGAEILAAAYMAAWAASEGRGFYLDSSKWNFFYRRGWQDYFRPYFSEFSMAKRLGIFDVNKPRLLKTRLQKGVLKLISGGRLFCPIEIFWKIWNRKSSEKEVTPFYVHNHRFSHLGKAASEIIRHAFVPWQGVSEEARARFPCVQETYDVGVFLRGGDKDGEVSQPSIDKTMEAIVRLNKKNGHLFFASDDFKKISDCHRRIPHAKVNTLCPKEQKGHYQRRFNCMNSGARRTEMLRYLQILDTMRNAKYFIGPFSSNFARLACVLRGETRCVTTDFKFCIPTPFA